MFSDQSAASAMTTSPRHHAPPRQLPPRQMSPVTLGLALHYPLQHYSTIWKKSAGQILPVMRKDQTQTNPKSTLIKWPHSRRPTRNKPIRGDRDPPTPLLAGKPTRPPPPPPQTVIWHMEWHIRYIQVHNNKNNHRQTTGMPYCTFDR